MEPESESEDNIEDLISQLQDEQISVPREPIQDLGLTRDNIEQFIISNAGQLVNDSIETVNTLKQFAANSTDSEYIESLASLIRSSSNAIDSLSKIVIQDKKTEASKELKALDYEYKKLLRVQGLDEDPDSTSIRMSREELMTLMLRESNTVDAEVVSGSNDDTNTNQE